MPVGVSQVAWFRVFASDKSGAVSIEFVVLVASLMGLGTLSAVTVQSGALVRAGVIGQELDTAQELAGGPVVPTILPVITPGGVNLPGGETPTGGDGGSDDIPVLVASDGGSGGGGLPGGSSSGDGDECPALILDPDSADLDCDEQADAGL